ncbi:MAG: hypothetical protein FJZ11_05440 [Candidatus Omnitrophica bacterium]|nr:hypothetical protein [Candidatus Omnitrophota bacterium]
MNKKFIKVYKELDIEDVSQHLLIIGEALGTCNHCSQLGVDPKIRTCPGCKTEFRYATFSSSKDKSSQIVKIANARDLIFVDYEDYRHLIGEIKAKKLFG